MLIFFNISKIIVGLTIVSFATSAPEMIVSVKSALAGYSDIALGNVVGSNIFNILLQIANGKNNVIQSQIID